MELTIELRQVGPISVIVCAGRLVFGEESTTFREAVKRLLPTHKQIILNLTGVVYMDSGGLGTLVGIYSSARACGSELKLAGLGPRLRDVLQITKLVTVFTIYDNEQQAAAAFANSA